MHPCDEAIPATQIVDGYTKIENCSCQHCDALCKPPTINGIIGFFDGFDGHSVSIIYIVLGSFTLVWQLFQCLYKKPKIDKEWEELANSQKERYMSNMHNQYSGGTINKINNTASNEAINLYK